MFAITAKLMVTGLDEALARVDELQRRRLLYIAEELQWFGETVTEQMKVNHPPGGPHPEPGEMPVYGDHSYIDRTGQLTRSVGYTVEVWRQHRISVLVFATAPYAEAVEVGSDHARPYPFFWPSFYMFYSNLERRVAAAHQRAFEEMADKGRPS